MSNSLLSRKYYCQKVALFIFFFAIFSFTHAESGDPLAGSTPAFDAAPEKGVNYNSGDWGVADQNGAATYTYQVKVPEGRNGMAPSLALRYSSNLPLRGGLAVGWGLSIPFIERDLSLGVERDLSLDVTKKYYKIDLGNTAGRLVEVQDKSPYNNSKAYRVLFDSFNTRIFSASSNSSHNRIDKWIALTPDGVRHHFKKSGSNEVWHITSQVDPFGNTVRYHWTSLYNLKKKYLGKSLFRIEYTSNDSANILPYAKVDFEYEKMTYCYDKETNSQNPQTIIPDIPIGAAYRKGTSLVTGAQQLTAIKISTRGTQNSDWQLSKQIDLKYLIKTSKLHGNGSLPVATSPISAVGTAAAGTMSATGTINRTVGFATSATALPSHFKACKQNPLRYLTQIDVKAFDVENVVTVLPPIKFEYNGRVDLSQKQINLGGRRPKKYLEEITIDTPGYGQEGISGSKLNGLSKTLLDIDNDGISDYVSVIEENKVCTLVWQKGLKSGKFASQIKKSPLPTAPWFQEWRGNSNAVLTKGEGCTLSGQVAYRSQEVIRRPQGSRPYSYIAYSKGIVGYHFMDYTGDGRLDLLTQVWASSCEGTYDKENVNMIGGVCGFDRMDSTTPGGLEEVTLKPEGGTWRVYPGTGVTKSGEPLFRKNPVKGYIWVRAPMAIPPQSDEATVDNSNILRVEIPRLLDLDGDGFLDIIVTTPNDRTRNRGECKRGLNLVVLDCDWTVYFGSGSHKFPIYKNTYIWQVPRTAIQAQGGGKSPIKIVDINGDGLPDLVLHGSGGIYSYRNTGTGFEDVAQPLNENIAIEETRMEEEEVRGHILFTGKRGYLHRLLDIDGDGLLDMIWFEGDSKNISSTSKVKARFNLGDRFGNKVTLLFPEKWANSKRLFIAEWNKNSDGFNGRWHISNSFTDVNGDGFADLVRWHGRDGKKMSYASSPGLSYASDLLKKVTNGRGKEIYFWYSPSTNPVVVTKTDKGTLPSVTWVVNQITTKGGFNTPDSVTKYHYKTPNYASAEKQSGLRERSQFVGFSSNIKSSITNGIEKQVHKHYEYIGTHGDLVKTEIYRGGQLHKVTRKKWEQKTLFSELITQSLPISSETCITKGNNVNEQACFAQNDHVHRIQKRWEYDSSCNQFLNVHQIEGVGTTEQLNDLHTSYQYDIRCNAVTDPEDYRVREKEQTIATRNASNSVFDVAHIVNKFDDETGLLNSSVAYSNASTKAETKFAYDPKTGNLIAILKPMQGLATILNPVATVFNYDSNKLFIHETINESGHKTKTSHDVATGVLIKREGPNAIKMGSQTLFDTERWKIDGFGRVLLRSISIAKEINGVSAYEEHVVESKKYNDLNYINAKEPTNIRVKQRQDFDTNNWIPTEQNFDGRGRVLKTLQLYNGNMVVDTGYTYDEGGKIKTIETPDPRNTNNSVTSFYTRDGLGRVTHLQRPNDTSVKIVYQGMSQTITELTPDNTGGSKTKITDVFGRLIELQEHQKNSAPAVTRYAYDVMDNLKQITDAEGSITTMKHDWLGHRTEISRGKRQWLFQYDLNGNLINKRSPLPENTNPTPYVISYEYDKLDRLATKKFVDIRLSTTASSNTPPPAGAMSEIIYHYDEEQNGVGHLTRVDLPFGEIKYHYDVRGLITHEQRSFSLNGVVSMEASQLVERSYNALAQLTETSWQEGQNKQRWRISYDERGLVKSVDWFDRTGTVPEWKSVANYQRDLLGLPLTRTTSYGQERLFTYDVSARPLTDNVKLTASSTVLAARNYFYTGAGNLDRVVGHTNAVNADASYTYDLQHRLLSAIAPNGYRGNFKYSSTGNLLSADVAWNNSTETRNVQYRYGDLDPHAVDELTNITTGSAYAKFLYDDSGNMTNRNTANGNSLIHWDGLDQLRRVDTPNSSETYYYDHNGQRMLAVDPTQGVRFWFGEKETHYNLNGSEKLNYLHLSAGGPALARIENGEKIELQYADALQNLMFSLDKDSNVVASLLYGPFGEIVAETGGEGHRRQFNGKENDLATGLRYYGYRYYDPLILRWNSADPLYTLLPELGNTQPQRMNLYAFSLNNPVRYYDPDGREAKEGGDKKKPSTEKDCKQGNSDKCVEEDEKPKTTTKDDKNNLEETSIISLRIKSEELKKFSGPLKNELSRQLDSMLSQELSEETQEQKVEKDTNEGMYDDYQDIIDSEEESFNRMADLAGFPRIEKQKLLPPIIKVREIPSKVKAAWGTAFNFSKKALKKQGEMP